MHFSNLKDQFPSWVEEWGKCICEHRWMYSLPYCVVRQKRSTEMWWQVT